MEEILFSSESEFYEENIENLINNPKIKKCDNIIIIAALQFWDGIVRGFSVENSVRSVIEKTMTDIGEIFIEDSDLKGRNAHHDGCDHFLFRKIKDNLSQYELEDLLKYAKNADNNIRQEVINKYTESLIA